MVSRETQIMVGLLREGLLRENIFFDILATTHATYIPFIFLHLSLFIHISLIYCVPSMIPGCQMQMKDTDVGLMLIYTVQIFI